MYDIIYNDIFVNINNIHLENNLGRKMKDKEHMVTDLFKFGGKKSRNEKDTNLID